MAEEFPAVDFRGFDIGDSSLSVIAEPESR